MKPLEEVFLHTKPARMLVALNTDGENYASVLSRDIDCTYSHTVKILDLFEEHDLVEFTKSGRKKLIELTDAGEELADRMNDFISAIDHTE